jgi:hypothetical protein
VLTRAPVLRWLRDHPMEVVAAVFVIAAAILEVVRHGDPSAPLRWDAAAHLWAGLAPALALIGPTPTDAARMLWSQEAWPPLFGLLEMPLFYLFGPTALAPLVLAALGWVLAMAAIAVTAGRVAGKEAGWAAATLAAASPVWLGYAGMCMTETVGAALITAVLLAALTDRPWLAVGAATAAFFVKFNFGIPVLVCLAVATVVWRRWRTWLPAWAAFVVPAAVWFASPGKLSSFRAYTGQAHWSESVDPWRGVLVFGAGLFEAAGWHWLLGIAVCAAAVAGSVLHRGKGWPVALLLGVTLAMLLAQPVHLTRHLYPALPAVFILAGCALVPMWRRFPRWGAVAALGLALAAACLHPLARSMPRSNVIPEPERALLDVALSEVRAPVTLVYGAHGAACPEGLMWQLALRDPGPRPYLLVDPGPGTPRDQATVVLGLAIDPGGPSGDQLEHTTLLWRQDLVHGLPSDPGLRLIRSRHVVETGSWVHVYEPVTDRPRYSR